MNSLEQFYNNSWNETKEILEKRYPIILKMIGRLDIILDVDVVATGGMRLVGVGGGFHEYG